MKTYVSFEKKKKITINGSKTDVEIAAKLNLNKAVRNEMAREFIFDHMDDIKKVLNNSGLSQYGFILENGDSKIIMHATGTAKRSPEDEDNRLTGIYIADTRAQRKIFKAIARLWTMLEEKQAKIYCEFDINSAVNYDVLYELNDHEEQLTGIKYNDDDYDDMY